MRRLYHKLMVRYYGWKIYLFVQYIRVYNLCRGKDPLWRYTWKQIACAAIAAKIKKDRNAGIEPSEKTIKILRDMERDYKVEKVPI